MSVVTVREILHNSQEMLGKTVTLKGWVRTARDVKACAFVELNDGSTVANLQGMSSQVITMEEETSTF